MSGKTNFLKLKKPDSLDYYNIQDFNDNSDIIDKKAQELANNADEDRKRVDNLLCNNTIDTVEIGKTIIQDSGKTGNELTLEGPSSAWYYSLFGGAKNVDSNFCAITEATENHGEEYTVKLLNPGLYYMTFKVHAEMYGGFTEQVTALLRLHKSNTSDWSTYDVLDIETVEILKTENTSTYTKIHFLFKVAETSYIRMYICVNSTNAKQITFRINDCKIIVLDWEGKKSGAASETADVRLGVDGQTYKTAGEAVRKQFEMILKNCSGLQEFGRDTSGQISEHILGFANLVKLSKIESKNGFKVYQSETERNKILIVNETATGENTWEIADCTVYSEENASEERLFAGGTYNIFGVNSDTTIKFYDDSGEMIGNEVNCNYTIQEFTIPSNCTRLKIYVHLINPETFLNIFVCNYRKTIQEQINDISAKIDTMQKIITKLVTAPTLIADTNGNLQITENEEG